MPQHEQDIVRTEEVNEILTATPRWIFRWGISVVFILILTGIALSYFIRYPDILSADLTLTTLNPPVTLIAKSNGKLNVLLVKDKQVIQAHQIIGLIENTGNYHHVLKLDTVCDGLLSELQKDSLKTLITEDSLKTGELTPFYLSFLKACKEYNLFCEVNPNKRQINLLKADLNNYKELAAKYRKQQRINDEQLKLTETDYKRDKQLFESKAISARELDARKKEYLNALNSNEQSRITVSNVLIQLNSIEKNILQLQIQDYEQSSKLKAEVAQQLKTLKAEITKWRQLYVIESPVSGKISFFSLWAVNQNIKQGDELFYIIPEQRQQFIGKCILPLTNSGKVATGQVVNIKLDNYPFAEHGILQGVVSSISEVPNKEGYQVEITLSNGLTTSYHKTLTYKEQMKGKADIITKSLSVMDRVFFNLRKLVDKGSVIK